MPNATVIESARRQKSIHLHQFSFVIIFPMLVNALTDNGIELFQLKNVEVLTYHGDKMQQLLKKKRMREIQV